MKKQILKTITIIGLIFSSNLLATTPPTPEEYKEIVDSFKLKDTSEKKLSQTFRANGKKIKLELEKQDGDSERWQDVQHIITVEDKELGEQKIWTGIFRYDQKLFSVACVYKKNESVLVTVIRSSSKKDKEIYFGSLISYIDNNAYGGSVHLSEIEILKTAAYSQIPTYNPKEFYPYYNEQRILNRLYETNTCDKELTEKANIEVLVGDKWVPQEQSWNIKKEELNLNEVLKNLKEKKETNLSIENLNVILKNEELNQKTVQKYNDIAYYLQQKNANNEAIFLLEKIIKKFPNRTVAYLNLADAYDGINDKEKAKENYEKYINLMKQENKENKIPKRVLEFK